MNRRKFLQNAAVASAGVSLYKAAAPLSARELKATALEIIAGDTADLDGHTLISEFKIGRCTLRCNPSW
jgi:hypothetical protein